MRNLCRSSSAANSSSASGLTRPSSAERALGRAQPLLLLARARTAAGCGALGLRVRARLGRRARRRHQLVRAELLDQHRPGRCRAPRPPWPAASRSAAAAGCGPPRPGAPSRSARAARRPASPISTRGRRPGLASRSVRAASAAARAVPASSSEAADQRRGVRRRRLRPPRRPRPRGWRRSRRAAARSRAASSARAARSRESARPASARARSSRGAQRQPRLGLGRRGRPSRPLEPVALVGGGLAPRPARRWPSSSRCCRAVSSSRSADQGPLRGDDGLLGALGLARAAARAAEPSCPSRSATAAMPGVGLVQPLQGRLDRARRRRGGAPAPRRGPNRACSPRRAASSRRVARPRRRPPAPRSGLVRRRCRRARHPVRARRRRR